MHRRRALVLFVNSVVALIGGGLSAILGAFALRPYKGAEGRWVRAGALADLTPHVPVARVLAISRQDGWYRERARETVFLVWDGGKALHALSATCTHLGCQVRWDVAATRFRCPCHGGVFDAQGNVVSGPPPRPLARVEARVDGGEGVLVRL
ncbi:MAG: ubiquinol-cytochrome c reductase iron-sulfur subunit [Acidobacteria bacterium]|nr:ubiquinol-cytochrome c reductase iron-sulfur subunit [Acidobacteriota bacterium]